MANRLAWSVVQPSLPLASPASMLLRGQGRAMRCSPPVAAAVEEVATAPARQKVASIFSSGTDLVGQEVVIKGWVRTVRTQKTFSFVEVNDGSSLKGLQVVATEEIGSYGVVEELSTGAAVSIVGVIAESPAKGQTVELKASEVTLVGDCPADTYPLQKKRHSLEFLRSIAHLRPRTNTIGAVSRVRSALAYATHNFFQAEGFKYVQTPIVTASDCEGAGEMFRVTTLPVQQADKKVDDAEDFFGRAAYLTVSGQLSAETFGRPCGVRTSDSQIA